MSPQDARTVSRTASRRQAGRADALTGVPATHLFEGNTTRIAFCRDTWLRGYDYDFMELLAPQLTRRMVEAAQKGEGAAPGL